jgi:SAM-dependent methyltransferase
MRNPSAQELQTLYGRRFEPNVEYRQRIWRVLVKEIFQRYIPREGSVLDLGCGYGEFINVVSAGARFGMDLNPETRTRLAPEVRFLEQDCSAEWELPRDSLDLIFTSNFFEHLPDKSALGRTLEQAFAHLKPGGRLIAMGPNIRHVPGAYWDFWDHYLPLTERSLAEGLRARGFNVDECYDRFLPYTMVGAPQYSPELLRWYLRLRPAWRLFGRQFLVVTSRPR